MAQPSISNPIKILVNKSIESSIFPENFKAAQVSPLLKKNNSLDKGNYRLVSVLPCISKIYERAIHDQLMDFLDKLVTFNYMYIVYTIYFKYRTFLKKIFMLDFMSYSWL